MTISKEASDFLDSYKKNNNLSYKEEALDDIILKFKQRLEQEKI